MKKSHKNTEFSTKRCPRCGRLLKLRLVQDKPTFKYCFRCHVTIEAGRSHNILGDTRSHLVDPLLAVE